jgi:hypothetical protein
MDMVAMTRSNRSSAAIGAQWVVLSVLLLWLTGFALTALSDKPMSTAVRVTILLASYLLALCVPGLILVRTSFKYERLRIIMGCAAIAAIVLTLLRFLEMSIERLDCNTECANSIPYNTEVLINYSLPFMLVLAMGLIAWLAKPRR